MSDLVDICPTCATRAIPGAAYCYRCGSPLIAETFVAGSDEPAEAAEPHGENQTFDVEGARDPEISRDFEGAPGAGPSDPVSPDSGPAGMGPEQAAPGRSGPSGQTSGTGAFAETTPDGAAPDPVKGSGFAPDPALARALSGQYEIRMADWMSRGWTIFTSAGGLFIAFGAILWLVFMFATPILFILAPLFSAGFLSAALIARRGEAVRFSDFWLPFNDFLPLVLVWIVSCALLFAGLFTCGILTIYLWVGYQFAYLLVLDRKADFWEALEISRKVVTRRWLSLFAFAVILGLIDVLMFAMTMSVGMILAVPLTSCVLVEAYAGIFGVRGGLRRDPAIVPPPPIAVSSPIPAA